MEINNWCLFCLTFVIPITNSVVVWNFINVSNWYLILALIFIMCDSWCYTFYHFFNMIRNGWDGIKIMMNNLNFWLFLFNYWLVMLFNFKLWFVVLSWRSRSNSCGLLLPIASVELFFFDFIMVLNWLNIIVYYRNLSFRSFYWRRKCLITFIIRFLIWFISNKPISLKVIFLSWLFFFLLSTVWWFACFRSWALLFSHIFLVKFMHKVNDLL